VEQRQGGLERKPIEVRTLGLASRRGEKESGVWLTGRRSKVRLHGVLLIWVALKSRRWARRIKLTGRSIKGIIGGDGRTSVIHSNVIKAKSLGEVRKMCVTIEKP